MRECGELLHRMHCSLPCSASGFVYILPARCCLAAPGVGCWEME